MSLERPAHIHSQSGGGVLAKVRRPVRVRGELWSAIRELRRSKVYLVRCGTSIADGSLAYKIDSSRGKALPLVMSLGFVEEPCVVEKPFVGTGILLVHRPHGNGVTE